MVSPVTRTPSPPTSLVAMPSTREGAAGRAESAASWAWPAERRKPVEVEDGAAEGGEEEREEDAEDGEGRLLRAASWPEG